MNDKETINRIISKIESCFREGFILESHIIHYAESTLGVSAEDDIIDMLAGNENYGEGIIELVFSPDDEIRIGIEPLLNKDGIADDFQEEIIDHLKKSIKSANLIFPDTSEAFQAAISEQIIRSFVERLYLTRPVPYNINNNAETIMEKDGATIARVKIRNSRYVSTGERDSFLKKIIESYSSEGKIDQNLFFDLIEFLLNIFRRHNLNEDIYIIINDERRSLEKMLFQSKEFKEQNKRYNMEMLMSLKITPLAIDEEHVERKVKIADMILNDFFQ